MKQIQTMSLHSSPIQFASLRDFMTVILTLDLIGYDLEVQNKNQIKKKANHMIELYSYFK